LADIFMPPLPLGIGEPRGILRPYVSKFVSTISQNLQRRNFTKPLLII